MSENITLLNVENPKSNWNDLALSAINNCPKIKKEREKEILISRFGISGEIKTLQAIGTQYGITRERVRQIIANATKKIQENCESEDVRKSLEEVESFVEESGGYASLEELYSTFSKGDAQENNSLRFITTLSKDLQHVKNSHETREGFRLKGTKLSDIKKASKGAVKTLSDNKKVMSVKKVAELINTNESFARAALSASNKTILDDSNKWGLLTWPHVNPRSIRDKSKYVMTRHGKPIHYNDLAEQISGMGSKDVTRQSVHNELIKNSDFVLVGRGIYALSEWGYKPGIVEEVIVEVLEFENKPLHKDVIIERVLEKRIVKPSTIVLNLQKSRFKKVGKATYTIN